MLETLPALPHLSSWDGAEFSTDSFTIAVPFWQNNGNYVAITNFNVILFCFYFQSYDHCWCYGWRNYLVSSLKINLLAMLDHLFSGDCYGH